MNDTLRGMLESLGIIAATLAGCAAWMALVLAAVGGPK